VEIFKNELAPYLSQIFNRANLQLAHTRPLVARWSVVPRDQSQKYHRL